MKFEWDEDKRLANARKHGIDFADAITVFDGDIVMIEDDRFDYGETRFVTPGVVGGTSCGDCTYRTRRRNANHLGEKGNRK